MPQPKSSPAEVSMPTFATLEKWTRSQVQELPHQSTNPFAATP